MGHHHNQSMYARLVDRLNRFPQGAPPSSTLFAILRMLFSEEEAGLVAQLPIKPFSVPQAAKAWKKTPAQAQVILEELASRAILVDMDLFGEPTYCLPPPMAGFFEFALMRVRNDIDQKALSELFHQYMNVEDDFVRHLFEEGETSLGRVYPQEYALSASPLVDESLQVLDYERASHIIKTARHLGVSLCYCRHKKDHIGKACAAPQEICMTFNTSAHTLIKHGHARRVDVAECMDLLQKAQDHHLVQFGENNQEGVNFICNCCGCCCEALQAVKRFAVAQNICSNYILNVDHEHCLGCGKCAKFCPVDALVAVPATPGKKRSITLHEDRCLGCGVCVRSCPSQCLRLEERLQRKITPINTTHRIVLMAAERGKLQDLIFDNQILMSHRLLAALLGSIIKLPPVARNLAQKQLRSRYVEKMLAGK